jgi:hypothetical protein
MLQRRSATIVAALLVILSMAALSVTLIYLLGTLHAEALEDQFVAQVSASASQPQLVEALQDDAPTSDALVQDRSELVGTRVTLFSTDGQLLADSHNQTETAADGVPLPELRAAIETGFGRSVRIDSATGREVVFLAFPIQDGDKTIGTIR